MDSRVSSVVCRCSDSTRHAAISEVASAQPILPSCVLEMRKDLMNKMSTLCSASVSMVS